MGRMGKGREKWKGRIEGGRVRTGDVSLLDALLAEPLGEDVGHSLGRESDMERKLGVVLRHGSDMLRNPTHRLSMQVQWILLVDGG